VLTLLLKCVTEMFCSEQYFLVFEDSFHAFVHRNADELRGRLHVTFQNEVGVDAGGLSREFFEILAKEMFNPNYALFMSTEDGCTVSVHAIIYTRTLDELM
jgi:hypothetical protein